MPPPTAATLATFADDPSLDGERGELLLDQAWAAIQNYTRQTIDLVTDDVADLRGTWSRKLLLPERPVVSVSSITVDGDEVTGWDRVRDVVHRDKGWGGPKAVVAVTYTHGYAADDIPGALDGVCMQVAARAASNPHHMQSITADGAGAVFGVGAAVHVLDLTAAEQAKLDTIRHGYSRP